MFRTFLTAVLLMAAGEAFAQQYPNPTFSGANISGAAGTNRSFNLETGSSLRWTLRATGIPESGGNVGSNFAIIRYDDTGAVLDNPLTIARSTGIVTLSQSLSFSGSSSGSTLLKANATASGTLTLPAATDTLIAKATVDTLTNKTFDTAGAGNVLRINGVSITAVSGTGNVALTTSPVFTTPNIGAAAGTSLNLSGLTASNAVATDASKNLVSVATTGTGNYVLSGSPALTGTPTAPTQATADSTTNLATTAFVHNVANAGVTSFKTRTGAVTPATGDYTTAQLTTSISASAPAAGTLGEVISCSAASGSAVTLVTATAANVANCNPLALTAGNWMCTANAVLTVNGANTNTAAGWISLTSATIPTLPNAGAYSAQSVVGLSSGTVAVGIPPFFVRSATSVNVFLSGLSAFTGTAPSLYGAMNCLRTN